MIREWRWWAIIPLIGIPTAAIVMRWGFLGVAGYLIFAVITAKPTKVHTTHAARYRCKLRDDN